MKIIPLSADSLGCRSMATYVETPGCKVLVDPAALLESFGGNRMAFPAALAPGKVGGQPFND